jgi:hypothetical protein
MERLGNLGVHTSRSCRPSPRGSPPPSAASATSPRRCPHARASTCSRRARRVLYVGTSRTCAPASAPTSPPPRPGPGWARWSASPSVGRPASCATPLEAEVRELRLIAEHKPRYNRRSRFPEKVHLAQAHREPWPRLSLVRRCSTTTPTTSARSPRRRPPRSAWPRSTRPSRSASATTGCPPRRAACVLAEMGRCLSRRATAAPTPDDLRRGGAPAARHAAAPPRRGRRGDQPSGWSGWPPTSASRRPASTATGWPASSAPPPAPSGSPRSPAAPRWSPPGARTTAAGRSTSCATAGSPRPA